ncbi:NHLP family bacteriocin export ABC transporter peptidase/permease/ATPase subunit [Falsiroseomonas tokyonensis]|uniref:NHLP family bacteriocin export ABC transporter peptidase/permease/ATPase subunit n=1 Tax=Falsiroseomonas tokyonensis TaxID=430521 RepID=A0ABV7BRR5_9PROT|nr:NHLP family bacteriocin export ABC transporter peptidase/permease/ATPase subunit [Falsiroseomonas tokyonensis]MBU8538330.1 NHLP family bacteriocin export ABC transporter peptidase/permease/ATPase subunit [Falsiroseomonas tokyonensis]
MNAGTATPRPGRSGTRVRTPTVLQMEAVECGAAALGIVLAHYGRWLALEELRVACGVSRDGSRASHVAAAARQYGLAVQAFRMEPGHLAGMKMPLIAHWGMNHFVVIEGIGPRHVYINDPASGPRRITKEELDRNFTGVALVLEPGPNFRKGGEPPRALGGILRRLRGNEASFGFLFGISLLLMIPALLVPAFSQIFVDDVLVGRFDSWLEPLLYGMAGAAAAMALITWLQLNLLLRLETRLSVAGSANFLERLTKLPVSFFAQRHPGDVTGRVVLNDRIARLVSGDVGRGLLGLVTAFVYALAMALYDLLLTAIVVLAAIVNLVALALLSRSLSDDNQRLLSCTLRSDGLGKQGLQMIETYRSAGSESLLLAQLAGTRAGVANITQRLALRRGMLEGLPAFVAILAAAAVLVLGGARIMEGQMTVGQLVAFQALTMGFMGPVAQLLGVATQMQDAKANLTLLEDTLHHPLAQEFAQPPARAASARFAGHIELRDVVFGHSRLEAPLLDGISLTIEPGRRLGIVGGSGSGKSTLALLIAGLYRPWSGEIRIDGRPLDSIPREELRREVAVVDQQGYLFDGTIRDNIAMWDPTLADERLVECAQDAAIHDEILARRGGYAGVVAEEGRNWSGGQRARLELARAIVTDPAILVLDEATASLDNRSEAALMRNLRRRGCTMIVIAHRLALVRDCDEVVVMHRGQIVQRGHPDELARIEGPFRTMLASG